jgi:hypothetical protein
MDNVSVEVDFDWYVGTEGYRLVEMHPRWAAGEAKGPLLMLCPPEGPAPEVRRYFPLDQYPALFRTFADTPTTPEGVLQFANRFGMLGGQVAVETDREPPPATPTSPQRFVGAEPVVAWLNAILRMRQAVALWDMVSAGDLAGIEQVIVQNLDGLHFHPKPEWFLTDWRRQKAHELRMGMLDFGGAKLEAAKPIWFRPNLSSDERFQQLQGSRLVSPARLLITQFVMEWLDAQVWLEDEWFVKEQFCLVHRPQSLAGALWLQFAHSLATSRRYRICNECGEWFEIPLRGARISREYCTNACRSKAYRKRQDRARALAAEGKEPREIARELDTTASIVRKWLKTGKGT